MGQGLCSWPVAILGRASAVLAGAYSGSAPNRSAEKLERGESLRPGDDGWPRSCFLPCGSSADSARCVLMSTRSEITPFLFVSVCVLCGP